MQEEVSRVPGVKCTPGLDLTYGTRGRGWGSSGHTVLTCQLPYIRAQFQLGCLPSKQEAACSFPHSFEYTLPLEITLPLPTHRPQPGFSDRPAGKEVKGRERETERDLEIERFPASLLSSPRLFQNAYCTPALPALSSNSVWGTQLEATPSTLITHPTPSRFGQAGGDPLPPVHAV